MNRYTTNIGIPYINDMGIPQNAYAIECIPNQPNDLLLLIAISSVCSMKSNTKCTNNTNSIIPSVILSPNPLQFDSYIATKSDMDDQP